MKIFEGAPQEVVLAAKHWLTTAQPVVDVIGPSGKPRQAPPEGDTVRVTFLVSDGLYIGEGPHDILMADPMGGLMINAAYAMLEAILKSHQD